MNRVEFTRAIAVLLSEMTAAGEDVMLDFAKRSTEEQQRLFGIGRDDSGKVVGITVTDCDGVNKVSKHQVGKAVDLLFLARDGRTLAPPKLGYEYWHKRWEELGGRPIIPWDKGHFEA